jgi:hypothetical protein
MMGRMVATVVGFLGGLMVVVGTVLPWLTVSQTGDPSLGSGSQTETLNGLTGVMGLLLIPIGMVVMVAALWLWAGYDVRRSAGLLGPLGLASGALAISVLVTKADAIGYGGFGFPSESVTVEAGVYVLLAGGVLAFIAAIVAALPERAAAEPSGEEIASSV